MERQPRGEAGEILVSWVVKVLVLVSVLAVTGYDAVSVGAARLAASDEADAAARAAAQTYLSSKNAQLSYDAALAEVSADGRRIDAESFTIDPTGAVTLTVRTDASTLVARHLGQLDGWRSFATTASARPVL